MPVRILPPHIANQIAAGEVIERPVSVVKELVENAIDAKASKVTVEVQKGGKALIKVVDDGFGMVPEDVELSIRPHATSKIHGEEDLYAIESLGFRGEALPSIGAVSDLVVKSRTKDADSGWMVRVSFGRNTESRPVPMPPGTIVEVRDLFLEIPARRRFLKSDQAELARISRLIRQYSAGFPDVRFRLLSGRRELFSSPKDRDEFAYLEPLFGREHLKNLIPVRGEGYGIRLSGAMSPPGHGVVGSRMCFFYINKRPFSSKLVLKAIKEAIRGNFLHNEYPLISLHFHMPPELVDVNCHPAKLEVRFRHQDQIFRLVYSAVKNAMITARPVYSPLQSGPGAEGEDHEKSVSSLDAGTKNTQGVLQYPIPADGSGSDPAACEGSGAPELHSTCTYNQTAPKTMNTNDKGVEILGQVLNTYIVGRTSRGLFLMDQHAAHEALLFKRINQSLEGKGRVAGQILAFPILVTLTDEMMERFPHVKTELGRLGFDIDLFGTEEIAIRKVPTCLALHGRKEEIIREVVEKAFMGPDITIEDLVYDLVASIACKGAVKAGHELHGMEITTLVNECLHEDIRHCPHGRPVFIVLDAVGLERLFKRS